MTDKFTMPTEDNIRNAAEKCPEAKAVLEELFPKVFEEPEPVSDFKVGDIVKHKEYGMGIIKMTEATCHGVEWFVANPDFHSDSGRAHPRHGWWVSPDYLFLVYRPKECC